VVLVMPNYAMPQVEYYEGRLGIRLPVLPVPFDEASLAATDRTLVTDADIEPLRHHLEGARDVWVVYRRTGHAGESDDRVLDLLRAARPELRHEALYGKALWLYRFGPTEPTSGPAAVPQAPSDLPSPAPATGERAGP
jgi:hypothetical protein